MLKIRRSRDRLIFNMVILYLGKTVIILKRGPSRITTAPLCPTLMLDDPNKYELNKSWDQLIIVQRLANHVCGMVLILPAYQWS